MKNLMIVSELHPDILPEGENWLVVGPHCWGRSRSLPVALENAVASLSYYGGTFTACVVPKGDLYIDDWGSYRIEGWAKDQQARAKETSRMVAVTKDATTKWTTDAAALLKQHKKALKE